MATKTGCECNTKSPELENINENNVNKLLEVDTTGLLVQECFGIGNLPQIGTKIYNAYYRLSDENWTITHRASDHSKQTSIENKRIPLEIAVYGPSDPSKLIAFDITTSTAYGNGYIYLEEAIDYLVKEQGFTYKKSELKHGVDLLLKKDHDLYAVCIIWFNTQHPDMFNFKLMRAR